MVKKKLIFFGTETRLDVFGSHLPKKRVAFCHYVITARDNPTVPTRQSHQKMPKLKRRACATNLSVFSKVFPVSFSPGNYFSMDIM
jgi:hypothetical protein